MQLIIVMTSSTLYKEVAETKNYFLAYLTNKRCHLLKTLVFSLLNCVLNYDCDGYKVPYANNFQKNKYVDKFYKSCLELLLIFSQYRPPSLIEL